MRFCTVLLISSVICFCLFPACAGNRDGGRPLIVEPVKPENPDNPGGGTAPKPLSDIFSYPLGSVIPAERLAAVVTDQTGQKVTTDYDGDGIPNSAEVTTNPYVADYPKIVTRIAAPITMEIQVSSTSQSENHAETVDDSGVTNTITNSMEDRQYSQLNQKTTPYVVKDSSSDSTSVSDSSGYSESSSVAGSVSVLGSWGASGSHSTTTSENESHAASLATSTSSEKTVFQNVDYVDNLDRNGVAFTDETVEKMTRNARISSVLKNVQSVGPECGVVRASLFLKNESVNFPARIKNLKCTLSFKTPDGNFLPVKTFILREENWEAYEQDIYGDEELGPFTLEIQGLNTAEVTKALKSGYTPQIAVVSYEIERVQDSNYNPGVNNLKIVEETAKGRTALIRIVGPNMRENYRVCAFDVDARGNVTPGVSLKKALFNIMRSRIGSGESWEVDTDSQGLTVPDAAQRWRAGAPSVKRHSFSHVEGNVWREFSTYVKVSSDSTEPGGVRRIESIRSLGGVSKYNPFDKSDNTYYSPNSPVPVDELRKMCFWYILHNGKYFEGDINDPIWAGERYEIVCFQAGDFNDHYTSFVFTPLQSQSPVGLSSLWNALTDAPEDPFKRGVYLGRVYRYDTVKLEIDLKETRYLFESIAGGTLGTPASSWNAADFGYRTEDINAKDTVNGIPGAFSVMGYGGGCHSITLDITPSENALKYEIAVVDQTTGESAKYTVNADALDQMRNRFTINRKTMASNGSLPLTEGTNRYIVNVKAWGLLYGVPVSSSAKQSNLQVSVSSSTDSAPGDNYSFSVAGGTEVISLSISGGSNAEYYAVRLIGPQNVPACRDTLAAEVFVPAGMRTIAVHPKPEYGTLVESGTPGVYLVSVHPVNSFVAATYASLNTGREQAVAVGYEKYASQKGYKPKLLSAYYDWNAIHLEVNFNDGTGWHKLAAIGEDATGNAVDCRYRKYYDQKNQKFFITFKPPQGGLLETFNAFLGGRDYVDCYIRTAARPEYRDRFWPRSGMELSYLGSSSFVNLWINGAGEAQTDASNMPAFLAGMNMISGLSQYSVKPSDYFFAPYEYRSLLVKAELSDSMWALAEQDSADAPTFGVSDSDMFGVILNGSLRVYGISSDHCDVFHVYYKQVSGAEIPQSLSKENVTLWPKAGEVNRSTDASIPEHVIAGLIPNSYYAIALVGVNAGGRTSERVIISPTLVKTTLAPGMPDQYSLAIKEDGKTIQVYGMRSANATHFQIQFKKTGITAWTDLPGEIAADPNGFTNAIIDATEFWAGYDVRVRAVNRYGDDPNVTYPTSGWGPVRTIATRMMNGTADSDVVWVDRGTQSTLLDLATISGSGFDYSGALNMKFQSTALPASTVLYTVFGTIIYEDYCSESYTSELKTGIFLNINPHNVTASKSYAMEGYRAVASDNTVKILPRQWIYTSASGASYSGQAYGSTGMRNLKYSMIVRCRNAQGDEQDVYLHGDVPAY